MDMGAWAEHLRALAEPAVDLAAPPRGGDVATPLWRAVTSQPVTKPLGEPMRPEVALWWLVAGNSADIDAGALPSELQWESDGALLPHEPYRAIEVWTDAELSAVHALSILARLTEARGPGATWRERVDAAAGWHLEHTQPDNATNRPWALHVFVSLDSAEGVLYAETLLHNALAYGGVPEPVSALILLSSARELHRKADDAR